MKNSKKIALGACAFLLMSSLASTQAVAAIKAGSSCTKAGKTSVSGSKTFTCVKSGKKLVWNKGVAQGINTALKSPTSFADLYQNRNGVPYAAWKSTAESIAAGKSNIVDLKFFLGPNTQPPKYKTPEVALGLVSQTFYKYKTPENVYVIQYSLPDIKWAEEKVKSIVDVNTYNDLDRNENGRLVSSNCGDKDCFGAKQVSTNAGVAFILQGVATGTNNDPLAVPRWELGQLEAHEFMHAMQRATITGMPTKEWPKTWIVEGSAELAQNLVMSNSSYDEYMKWRKLDSKELYGPKTKITKSFMTNYLKSNYQCGSNNEPCYQYNLGSRIMEIFVALKGPGVMLDLFRESALQGFESAFLSIFGVTWNDASPVINQTIVELFQSGE